LQDEATEQYISYLTLYLTSPLGEELNVKSSLYCIVLNTVQNRQMSLFGHVMRNKEIENIIISGKIVGKRSKERQKNYLYKESQSMDER